MAIYKQDDIIELEICSYGSDGEGVAKENGFVFFVPFAVLGEHVKVKVLHVNKKNLVFCELKEVLTPSRDRVKPVCNRFTRCGGCDMQHISYPEQLRIKRDNLVALLRKNARVDIEPDEVVPCSTPFGYRNKIQLPFGTVGGRLAMGFFREGSHKIVSITKCFLHGEWAEKLIGVFLEFANAHGLTAYDDATKKGLLRHMVVRRIGDEYSITAVTNGAKLPFANDLISRLDAALGECYALYNSVKRNHDNVILGDSVFTLKERIIKAEVFGIKMQINPYSFLQLNNEIRDKIYTRITEDIFASSKNPTVIDAYAGVGLLGAMLAKRGATVYNIEIVREATADGERLVEENSLSGKVFNINGDAAKVLPELMGSLNAGNGTSIAPIIILDPPRRGCDASVTRVISSISAPTSVYYISCNPATLTRDLFLLSESGFTVEYITPYDMFPQTRHIETLVKLIRR